MCYTYCHNVVLCYVSDDDDDSAAGDAAMVSSTSITSCGLGAAVATQAHSCGPTQQYSDPCPQESCHPACASPSSVPVHSSPSVLTRQQVYMILCAVKVSK